MCCLPADLLILPGCWIWSGCDLRRLKKVRVYAGLRDFWKLPGAAPGSDRKNVKIKAVCTGRTRK